MEIRIIYKLFFQIYKEELTYIPTQENTNKNYYKEIICKIKYVLKCSYNGWPSLLLYILNKILCIYTHLMDLSINLFIYIINFLLDSVELIV